MQKLIPLIRTGGNNRTFLSGLMASAAALAMRQMFDIPSSDGNAIAYSDIAQCFQPSNVTPFDGGYVLTSPKDRCALGIAYWVRNQQPVEAQRLANALSAIVYLSAKAPGFKREITALRSEIERAL